VGQLTKTLAATRQNYNLLAVALRPICEPVELPLGRAVIAERVTVAADMPAIGSFKHYHDVAELVLFRRVRGAFIAEGQRHRLGDGAITFVPSMRQHDFALGRGAMEWVLIQVDPYLVETLARQHPTTRLNRAFCAIPGDAARSRIDALADWLVEAAVEPTNPAIASLVELLLIAAVEAPEPEPVSEEETPVSYDRLRPVLECLRASPGQPISLEDAAGMSNLSPAYFSRRFRQMSGMPFTEYSRIYRLHLAARRLATTGAPVSEIGYDVGFSSPAHFTARFRERFGMTPREYRKSAVRRGSRAGEG
jgi:AraC-like DNA-binding protein